MLLELQGEPKLFEGVRIFFQVHCIDYHPQFEFYTSRKSFQIPFSNPYIVLMGIEINSITKDIYICIYKLYLNIEAPRG
jgi:hypothetical protein